MRLCATRNLARHDCSHGHWLALCALLAHATSLNRIEQASLIETNPSDQCRRLLSGCSKSAARLVNAFQCFSSAFPVLLVVPHRVCSYSRQPGQQVVVHELAGKAEGQRHGTEVSTNASPYAPKHRVWKGLWWYCQLVEEVQ